MTTLCTKFGGGLLRLHEADEAAVDWLTTYGSLHTIIIIMTTLAQKWTFTSLNATAAVNWTSRQQRFRAVYTLTRFTQNQSLTRLLQGHHFTKSADVRIRRCPNLAPPTHLFKGRTLCTLS